VASPSLQSWIDIETTGLDPAKDLLLEIAVVLTTPDGAEEIADFRCGLTWPPDTLHAAREAADPYVQEMHTKNKLWDWMLRPEDKVVPDSLDNWLCTIGQLWAPERLPIGGFTPRFDREWLAVYAPRFVAECLNHRLFDMSTAREMVSRVYPAGFGPAEGEKLHRALGDCRDAIRYWQWFRANVMSPYGRRVVNQ
jgi:oligoribonuclease